MKIVLINPDIPWNAGNIGRTCVATGTELAFVGKMGFELSANKALLLMSLIGILLLHDVNI